MKRLDICIPVYNEVDVIARTIEALFSESKKYPEIETFLIVSDNASTDGTAEVVARLDLPRVSVLVLPERGKGYAIREVARRSRADFFSYIDADLSAPPESLFSMLAFVERGGCDIAVGSRLLDKNVVDRSWWRTLSSKAYNALAQSLVPVGIKDVQCGLKVMNRRGLAILQNSKEKTWFLDLEFLARASQQGLRIVEFPVRWVEFRYGMRKSKLSIVRDGFRALLAIIRIRVRLYNRG